MENLLRCSFCDEENLKTNEKCLHCDEILEVNEVSVTRLCPFCDETILRSAIKCKHCREWVNEPKPHLEVESKPSVEVVETKICPCCSEEIAKDATRCKHCSTWLNEFSKAKYEGVKLSREEEGVDSSVSTASSIIYVETIAISVIIYSLYDIKLWEGIVACLVLFFLLSFRWIRLIYCLVISVIWGMIGVVLAPVILDENDFKMMRRFAMEDYSDYMWIGLIVAIASLVFHLPAISKDYNRA